MGKLSFLPFEKKYAVIVAAIVMQTCLGGIYAWSAFVPSLRDSFGFTSAQTQFVFGTCVCVFTFSMIFTGRLQDVYGPRPLAIASGLLLGVSYLTASLGGRHFFLLWFTIGCLGGLGIGCGYVCPIATAVKWFPEHKGLVCGLAVAGYGGGAILLSSIVEILLNRGWEVLHIFRSVGIVYGSIVMLAGSLLFLPEQGHSEEASNFRRRTLLKDRRLWRLAVAMFCGTFPGLMIIGNLKPIGLSFGNEPIVAAAAISTLSIGNATGRIVWGFVYDRLGGRHSVLLSLSAITISAVGVIIVGGNRPGLLAASTFVGFCYGGNFALYPAQVTKLYGAHAMGTVYSLVMIAHGIAAEGGPVLGGLSFDITRSFVPGLAAASGVAVVGLAVYAYLSRSAGRIDD